MLVVSVFFSGLTPGYMSIYIMYFYNQVLYLGRNTFLQCSSPDGFVFALPSCSTSIAITTSSEVASRMDLGPFPKFTCRKKETELAVG